MPSVRTPVCAMLSAAFLAVSGFGAGAPAQCPPEWRRLDLMDVPDDFLQEVRASAIFNDGSGPSLYVGGQFFESAFGYRNSVRRWNGTGFEPVGGLLAYGGLANPGEIRAMAVFDNGSGPALYAAGQFVTEIPLGSTFGAANLGHIAKWNGTSWVTLNGGVTGSSISAVGPYIFDLHVHDDGTGPKLYAAGDFNTIGGLSNCFGIARWTGSRWELVGPSTGMNGSAWPICLTSHDFDGAGPQPPRLVVGGGFDSLASGATADRLAVWDGTSWSSLPPIPRGDGQNLPGWGFVTAMASFDDDGPGPHAPSLIIGLGSSAGDGTGAYGSAPERTLYRLDGAQWVSLEPSPLTLYNTSVGSVRAMDVFDDGSGPALFIGSGMPVGYGYGLSGADQPPLSHYGRTFRKWNGVTLEDVGGGVHNPTNYLAQDSLDACAVSTLCSLAPLGRSSLFVGGLFGHVAANTIPANNAALWNVPSNCCRADFNSSGTVTVQDIFDFLAAYFSASTSADFNASGTVTVQDIFDYLAAYFVGCP